MMTLAIKAQNFKIPLQDLSKYLEFATNRAIITGKSVSELVELIVTGIGRKSSRSMIQLGLSAKEVQEAFKSTNGFMQLVDEEMVKMGDVADTTEIKTGRLAATFKDFKETIGEWINQSPAFQSAIKNTQEAIERLQKAIKGDIGQGKDNAADIVSYLKGSFSGDKLKTELQGYINSAKTQLDDLNMDMEGEVAAIQRNPFKSRKDFKEIQVQIAAATEYLKGLTDAFDELNKISTPVTDDLVTTIADLNLELEEEKKFLQDINSLDIQAIQLQLAKIKALEDYIKKLTELRQVNIGLGLETIGGKGTPQTPTETDYSYENIIGGVTGLVPPIDRNLRKSNRNKIDPADYGGVDVPDAIKKTQDFYKDWQNAWDQGFKDVIGIIADGITGIFEAIGSGDFSNFGGNIIGSFGKFISQIGRLVFIMGALILYTNDLLFAPTIPNALAAMAIGAAAMAVGGLITGIAKGGAGGGFAKGGRGGGSAESSTNNLKVVIEGRISGKDIVFVSRRYMESER
jgi:hypothetical protein